VAPPRTDWLYHHLRVCGAPDNVSAFRAATQLQPGVRPDLAGQLSDAAEVRQRRVAERAADSRACRFDLYPLLSFPDRLLRLRSDQPEPDASVPVLAGSCEEHIVAQEGKNPTQSNEDRHEKARDLGEEALGKLAEGQEAEADQLIEEAKKLDESALKELVQDLEEDAGSDPDAAKTSEG
jgi:hypothetical protein